MYLIYPNKTIRQGGLGDTSDPPGQDWLDSLVWAPVRKPQGSRGGCGSGLENPCWPYR